MRNEFEDAFKTSMNTLRFSPEDKKRITEKIIQTHTEQRRINMNKWTLPKAAAIAATCLLVTGGTVFAASKIIMYTASSNANYDYSSATEMNSATPDRQENAEVKMPDFPDSLGGYSFDGGNTVYVAGKDDSGNTLGKWDDLSAVYKNEDGDIVNLTLCPTNLASCTSLTSKTYFSPDLCTPSSSMSAMPCAPLLTQQFIFSFQSSSEAQAVASGL